MDRRQDVNGHLTEVRTVLSRAETALATLKRLKLRGPNEWFPAEPEEDDMITDLELVVATLDRYRGKRKRRAARWQ